MKLCLALFTVFPNVSAVHIPSLVSDVENDAAEDELKDNEETEQDEMQDDADKEEEEVVDREVEDAEVSLVEEMEQESEQVDGDEVVDVEDAVADVEGELIDDEASFVEEAVEDEDDIDDEDHEDDEDDEDDEGDAGMDNTDVDEAIAAIDGAAGVEDDDDDEDGASFREEAEEEEEEEEQESGMDDAGEGKTVTKKGANDLEKVMAEIDGVMNPATGGESGHNSAMFEVSMSSQIASLAPLRFGSMMHSVVHDAHADLHRLEAAAPALRAAHRAAWKRFRWQRRALKRAYRHVKRHIRRNPKTNASAYAHFKFTFKPLEKNRQSQNFSGWEKNATGKPNQLLDEADDQEWGFHPLAALRKLKNKAVHAVKRGIKAVKHAANAVIHCLSAAHFKVVTLPKITSKFKPILAKVMSAIHLPSRGAVGAAVIREARKLKIKSLRTIMDYVSMKLHAIIGPPLKAIFSKIEKLIWTTVDPLVAAAKGLLMTLVGAIPFVGGLFSVIVSSLFEAVMGKAVQLVAKKLGHFEELLENMAVGIPMKMCFKEVKGKPTFVGGCAKGLAAAKRAAMGGFNNAIGKAYKDEAKKTKKQEVPHSDIVWAAKKQAR